MLTKTLNKLTVALFASLALLLATPALAATIYDSIPEPVPQSSPSLGYQATQTFEFGDYIEFTGTERDLESVQILMNSWACQEGAWNLGTCANPDDSSDGYEHDITLNIYEVDTSGAEPVTGALIASKTETVLVPWRPASDPTCPNGQGYLPDCNNGFNFVAEFDFSGQIDVLPDAVVYGVAFNTQTYGENPTGVSGPYNSLNVSVPDEGATVGTDVDSDAVFWNRSGAGFMQDTGWTGYVPAALFDAIELPEPSLEITAPAEDGEILMSGEYTFTAEYVDYDGVEDNINWALKYETCEAGTPGANVAGFSVPNSPELQYNPETGMIEVTVDMTDFDAGEYCFVVNPVETAGPNLREVRSFYLADAMVSGGGQILEEIGKKKKDHHKVSFGGWLARVGDLMGDWTIQFHNVGNDTYDKTTFHAEEFTALNLWPDNGTCEAMNFTATGSLDGEDGWKVVVRGGDSEGPASMDPDTLRVSLYEGNTLKYDTHTEGEFSDESSCVGSARTKIDNGNLTITQ